MKKSFKLLILSTFVLIMGTFFVGCNKNYSEEISFFNYGENIDEETIKEFEKEYGIKVNVETFDDMETMYQKVSNSGVTYDVILVSDEGKIQIGNPYVKDVKVEGKVVSHGKAKKIIVFKMKAKKNYRRKQGHRQPYTKVEITAIKTVAKKAEA